MTCPPSVRSRAAGLPPRPQRIARRVAPAAALALCAALLAVSARAAAPVDAVDMGGYLIDRTEVTVARFDAFLTATGARSAAEREGGGFEWGAGWERRPGWTFRAPSGRPARPDDPAAHVSWFEATAFCAWAGGRLPSRDEWAGAAYTERRAAPPAPFVNGRSYPYPTGDAPAGANFAGAGDGHERHAPAGSTAAGVNGLHEMAGNLWEWLADARGDERLTAGGSWWYGPAQARADGMQYKPAGFYAVYVGLRCVYPPRPAGRAAGGGYDFRRSRSAGGAT
jgi:formylglycine-generating enzyme required for sulfatase activity